MFGRLFDKWALGRQRKELSGYIALLEAMDGQEIGLVVASATDIKNSLVDHGVLLDDPFVLVMRSPEIIYEFSSRVVQLQREGNFAEAAALMVWVHTLRAASRLELRGLGRAMWGQLERGFPYIKVAAEDALLTLGIHLDVSGASEFPQGLSPTPS